MSAWNDLVKKTFKEGKAKNAAYSLGDAMKDAKKVYKTSSSTLSNAVKGVKGVKPRATRKTGKARRTRRRH